MAHLVITVLAIALAALLVAGGVNYMSSDTGLRIETSNTLSAHHSALSGAVSSYRLVNGGYVAHDVDLLRGYLPRSGSGSTEALDFPRGRPGLAWRIASNQLDGARELCLERTGAVPADGVLDGVAVFVNDMASRRPGDVTVRPSDGCAVQLGDEGEDAWTVCPGCDPAARASRGDFVPEGASVTFGRL